MVIDSDIVVTFNEAIQRGTGNIVLKTSTGSTVATYNAASSGNLTISGNTLTIDPSADLAYGTGYKVEFAAGSIKDLTGNAYAGGSSYNFTTATVLLDDYANDASTTGEVLIGTNHAGILETLTDSDWFAVQLIDGVSYRFDVESNDLSSGFFPDLVLRDAAGRVIDVEYDGNDIYYAASDTGEYYLEVSNFDFDDFVMSGGYTVEAQVFADADQVFENHGGLSVGLVGTLADFSKAAYSLADWEKTVSVNGHNSVDNGRINDEADSGGKKESGRHADDVLNALFESGEWIPLDLYFDQMPKQSYLKQEVNHDDGPDDSTSALSVTTEWLSSVDEIPDDYEWGKEYDESWTTDEYVYGIINNGFENGTYTYKNSAALVARCGDSIVLSFRGTNDNRATNADAGTINSNDEKNAFRPDVGDWNAMGDHYENFSYLIGALDDYVAGHHEIEHVYVTGHSLGGGMALGFMDDHDSDLYQAITFAAPYFDNEIYDKRITCIEIQDDPVPAIGGLVDPEGDILYFIGDKTIQADKNNADNHSMEYYRDLAWDIDDTAWEYLLGIEGGATQSETEILLAATRTVDSNTKIEDFTVATGNDSLKVATSESEMNAEQVDRDIDCVIGGGGEDTLRGDSSRETFFGGDGADTVSGMNGNDVIHGGLGNDRLTGGSGADDFVFDSAPNASSNVDTITDFRVNNDDLQFSQAIFTGLSRLGALSSGQLRSGSGIVSAGDSNDRFIYNTTSGALYYDADGTGSSVAVKVAIIGTTSHPAIGAADIEVIA